MLAWCVAYQNLVGLQRHRLQQQSGRPGSRGNIKALFYLKFSTKNNKTQLLQEIYVTSRNPYYCNHSNCQYKFIPKFTYIIIIFLNTLEFQ